MFGNKSPISSHSKTIRSFAPSSLPAKNSNGLLLIVIIPGRTWIACREEAGAPAFVTAGPPSRPPHWDCGVHRCDLGVALGWPPQPTQYLLDHASRVRPRRRRPAFVDRGDTRWDFLGVEHHRLQSIPWYANRSRESRGLLPLQDQSLLHCTQGIQWSPARHRGWARWGGQSINILLYRDNDGAATDDTTKWYMRLVAGSSSTTSRWLSNEWCLPSREKAARALHYLIWRVWGKPLPPPAQVL
jgi:hypothetical protein